VQVVRRIAPRHSRVCTAGGDHVARFIPFARTPQTARAFPSFPLTRLSAGKKTRGKKEEKRGGGRTEQRGSCLLGTNERRNSAGRKRAAAGSQKCRVINVIIANYARPVRAEFILRRARDESIFDRGGGQSREDAGVIYDNDVKEKIKQSIPIRID